MKTPLLCAGLVVLVAIALCLQLGDQSLPGRFVFRNGNTGDASGPHALASAGTVALKRPTAETRTTASREQMHDWLEVTDPADQPVAGAHALLVDRHDKPVDERVTDGQGRLDLLGVKPHKSIVVVYPGLAATRVWPDARKVRLRPLAFANVRIHNVAAAILEDFELQVRVAGPNQMRERLRELGLLRWVPLQANMAQVPLLFALPCSYTVWLEGRHRASGRMRYFMSRQKHAGSPHTGNDEIYTSPSRRRPCPSRAEQVVFDLGGQGHHLATSREWVMANILLPDDRGGMFYFAASPLGRRLHVGGRYGTIPHGKSNIIEPVCGLGTMDEDHVQWDSGIEVRRDGIFYRLPLAGVRVRGSNYITLRPAPCSGVLEIEVDRHPKVPANERLNLHLDYGHGHAGPNSMRRDPSQTLGDGVIRVEWLPTSNLNLRCLSETGQGLSIQVDIQDGGTTRVRMPIAPKATLNIALPKKGHLWIVHEATGHTQFAPYYPGTHDVRAGNLSHTLPIGRYRLTFKSAGVTRQKTIDLQQPDQTVRF